MHQRSSAKEIWSSARDAPLEPDAVTVAISLYHYETFITECLDSVHAQHHQALELVVVDDCSAEDDSLEVARAWLARHGDRFGRASLLQHRHNSGLAATRNTAFRAARTDYVFVLDADNAIYPAAIGRLAEASRRSEGDVVYSQLELYGDQRGVGQADVWSRERFKRGNYIDAMALIRKRSWMQVGGYDHIEGGWEDFDLWCKFVEAGMKGIYVPEILCRYRVHGSSMLRRVTGGMEPLIQTEMTARHPWLCLPM